jgi:UDP-N-acetylmuramoylalanine--D-glutamate ligase
MKDDTFSQSKVAVLGAGESGRAAARLLVSKGARVTVYDEAPVAAVADTARAFLDEGIEFFAGPQALEKIPQPGDYSLMVLSPGIDPKTALVRSFLSVGIPVLGELELAFLHCEVPVVAVTGTNGKTTTTQLVEAMFNAAAVPTVACGNIGPAFSAKVSRSSELRVMTVEVSSFQLEQIRTFRPFISVWLNFTADHLDRYSSMREYFDAKCRIFENQTESDWAVVNGNDELPPIRAQKLTFSAYSSRADFTLENEVIFFRGEPVLPLKSTRLRGRHNAENLMAALGVGHAWGLSWEQMRGALNDYKPLPHRCEWISTVKGVDYFNDSKATNLDAMEKALLSEDKPVVLIAGGKDKGFEFDTVTALVAKKCRCVVLIGEMAGRIEALWGKSVTCHRCASLREAVNTAHALAQSGDVVLFSPGTSSFDMFKNYADRGDQFRELVTQIAS